MNILTRNMLVVLFALAPAALWAAAPAETPAAQTRAALSAGGDSVVQNLVAIGKTSADAAAVVIELTVRSNPNLLEETMMGLSQTMEIEDFARAADRAAAALVDKPKLRALVLLDTQRGLHIAYNACVVVHDNAGQPRLKTQRDTNLADFVDALHHSDFTDCASGGSSLRLGEPPVIGPPPGSISPS